MKYEERICLFVDILGFKDLVNETIDKSNNDNEEKIDQVISVYNHIHSMLDTDHRFKKYNENISSTKQVSIFSDCIVISFKLDEPRQIFITLYQIQILISGLINFGILCRGAVSLGKLIHSEMYIFGPALIEAYLLESKAALYPRIILDRNIIQAAKSLITDIESRAEEEAHLKSLLKLDSDGMFYIDYYESIFESFDSDNIAAMDYITKLGDIIRKGLMGSSHHTKIDIKIKYAWMRERYNNMVDFLHSESFQNNVLDHRMKLDYRLLKKISPSSNLGLHNK